MKRCFTPIRARAVGDVWYSIMVVVLVLFGGPAYSQDRSPGSARGEAAVHSEQGNLAEIGAKLSNPVSDVWALFTEFDVYFSDGDVNEGDSQAGGRMLFQPILPLPLYGSGNKEWKLITRPTVPLLFSQPVPTGFNEFAHRGGLADTQLPMLVSPPAGNWLLGLGPAWLLPTSTDTAFGRQQWGVGPTAVVGYKTKDWIGGVFPQYYFGFADRSDHNEVPRASYLNLLYFAFYNLPDAWQIGTNPTITFDDKATSGNKWNVPLGLTVAKTTRLSGLPVKVQLGIEYSVVSQDDFGQRAQIKLNLIPVIPSLIESPILGGG
jgi:hypothetical protein